MDSDSNGIDSCYNDSETSMFNIGVERYSSYSSYSENKLMRTIRDYLESKESCYDYISKPETYDFETIAKNQWKVEGTSALSQTGNVNLRLSHQEIALVCPLIEDAIGKLNIVKRPYPDVKIYFDFLDVYERFKFGRERTLLNLNDHGDILARENFALELGRLQKLLRLVKDDLLYAEDSFIDRYVEVNKLKSKNLNAMITSNRKLSERLYNLKEDIKHLHNLAETTRKNSPVTSLHRQEISDETNIKIGTLIEYVKKYDKGRIEQNRLKLEVTLKREIEEKKQKAREIEEENICHEAIIAYCKKSQNGLEADIDYWEKKYIRDMEDIDLKMDYLNEETGENASKLSRLLEDYNQRQMQINLYESEKEEIFERQILDSMMESVILAAQSWFRGSMVRWELGQYSVDFERKRSQSAVVRSSRQVSEPEDEAEEEVEEEEDPILLGGGTTTEEEKTQEDSSQPTEEISQSTEEQPKELLQ